MENNIIDINSKGFLDTELNINLTVINIEKTAKTFLALLNNKENKQVKENE
jgi:hypothetical protein